MRIASALFVGGCCLAFALSAVAGDKPKAKKGKVESVAALASRVMGNRWRAAGSPDLFTMIPYEGNDFDEELLGIVEFSDGGLGLYVARQNEDRDEWITLTRQEIRSEMFEAVLKRSKSR